MRTASLLIGVVILSACAPTPEPDSAARADGPEPGLVCAGASVDEARTERHPKVVRGVVKAPPAAQAARGPALELVASAHAFAMEFEVPVSGAPVSLRKVDASGAPRGEPLVSTTTDAQGRFCVRVPDEHAIGVGLALFATTPSGPLRRVLVTRADASLDAQSEARYRVLARAGVDFERLEVPAYLNWRTVADTRLGLLGEVDQDTARPLDALLTELTAELERGERVKDALAALPKRP